MDNIINSIKSKAHSGVSHKDLEEYISRLWIGGKITNDEATVLFVYSRTFFN